MDRSSRPAMPRRTSGSRRSCPTSTSRSGRVPGEPEGPHAPPARARLASLAPLAWATCARASPTAGLPRGLAGRAPRLRRRRGAEGGHLLVERPHLSPPGRPPRGQPAEGAALLRPCLGGRVQRRRPAALLALLPAAGGRHERRVDTRVPHRLLDARAARARRARYARAYPAARPARAI